MDFGQPPLPGHQRKLYESGEEDNNVVVVVVAIRIILKNNKIVVPIVTFLNSSP